MNVASRVPEAKTAGRRPTYIIDDDASVRVALERLLLAVGLRVRAFASAADFLRADVLLEGACVVADVTMHGMTGIELCRKLKAEGRRVAFVFVTAYDTPEARQEARDAGAIAYFRKPVDDQALIDAIEWALSRR